MVADTPAITRDAGFEREVRETLARRRQWLIEQDLARAEQDRIVYRANLLGLLRRRELARVESGQRIEGIYRRAVDLVSGRFTVIERSREFMLVPWRPVLERNLGKQVSGAIRGENISWELGRRRRGPSIS